MNRFRLFRAILVGLQVLVAGSALADLIGQRWAGLLALLVAAAQATEIALSGPSETPSAPPDLPRGHKPAT
jgi:hypothetical protein